MTHYDIDRLSAGAELDSLVAKACGMEQHHAVTFGWPWCPSKDWNDAMLAAEKSELFDGRFLGRHSKEWIVFDDGPLDEFKAIGSAPTGPLAIARAIAKLGVKP